MGLHPWELYRYTWKEFTLKRKGFYELSVEKWHQVRLIAYYAAAPHMKKGFKMYDIIKLPDDKKEEVPTRQRVEAARNRYKQAGAL